jgi:hypothetical protein
MLRQKGKQQHKKSEEILTANTVVRTPLDAEKENKQNHTKDKCQSSSEFGHLASSKACPNKKKKDKEEGIVNTTWQEYEVNMFTTIGTEQVQEYIVNNTVNVTQALQPNEMLFDNHADISIVHPSLLENVRKASKSIRVKGVGGIQLVVDHIGTLNGFFKCMPQLN